MLCIFYLEIWDYCFSLLFLRSLDLTLVWTLAGYVSIQSFIKNDKKSETKTKSANFILNPLEHCDGYKILLPRLEREQMLEKSWENSLFEGGVGASFFGE